MTMMMILAEVLQPEVTNDNQHRRSVLEVNAMLIIVATVKGEMPSISYLNASLWGATVGLVSPRSSVVKLLPISCELTREIDNRVKSELQNDIDKNPDPEVDKERKRRKECRKRKRQWKIEKCMEM